MKRLITFLIVFLLAAGCDNYLGLGKFYSEGDLIERIGIIAHTDISWPNSTSALKRALAFYREQGVSEVIVLGDPTRNGYSSQMEVFKTAVSEAFRGAQTPKITFADDSYSRFGISWHAEGRFPLTDLFCIHPLNGGRINVGSMHGIVVSDIFSRQDQKTIERQKSSAQGLLILRYSHGLVVRRMDFSEPTAAEILPAWEVDTNGLIVSQEGASAPEFWPDTVVSVIKGYDNRGNVIYTVRWPPVLLRHTGERAFSYDVSVGRKVVRSVQSKGFHLPEGRDTAAISCIIPEKELFGAEPVFGVTPVSSMGKKGKTVYSR